MNDKKEKIKIFDDVFEYQKKEQQEKQLLQEDKNVKNK